MRINDFMIKDAMIMDLKATEKSSAIDEMVQRLYDVGRITNIDQYKKDIWAREKQTTTGLGDGIAMPHAKNNAVKEATVLFAKSKKGVDYESLDGQPAYLFFMIAAPEGADDTHLQALAALSRQLVNQEFVEKLKKAETPEQVQEAFSQAEAQKAEEEKSEATTQTTQAAETSTKDRPYVVPVTACPTCIAHTHIAEESLKQKAKELDIDIKVETNGSDRSEERRV